MRKEITKMECDWSKKRSQNSTKRNVHSPWGEGRAREDILMSSNVILMTSTQKWREWTSEAWQSLYWWRHNTKGSMSKGRGVGSLALRWVLLLPSEWNVDWIVEGLVSKKAREASRCQAMLGELYGKSQ